MFFSSDFDCIKYKGLCIIPIETKLIKTGLVQDIIRISYLDDIIDLSNRKGLYVKYLSTLKGLVDYDTYIGYESGKVENPLYYKIVAEQIYRECLDRSVSVVYFMSRKRSEVSLNLVKSMERYGIEVISPIMGFSLKAVPNALLFYR